jgi:hypothetical protein
MHLKVKSECLVQRRCVEITLRLVWIAPFQSFLHNYGTLIAISTAFMFMTNCFIGTFGYIQAREGDSKTTRI